METTQIIIIVMQKVAFPTYCGLCTGSSKQILPKLLQPSPLRAFQNPYKIQNENTNQDMENTMFEIKDKKKYIFYMHFHSAFQNNYKCRIQMIRKYTIQEMQNAMNKVQTRENYTNICLSKFSQNTKYKLQKKILDTKF